MDVVPPGGSRCALALGVGVGDHLLVGVDALHQPAARQQPVLHRRVGARPATRNGGWGDQTEGILWMNCALGQWHFQREGGVEEGNKEDP